MKKKLTDWLKPKVYKPDQQEAREPDVLERTLLDIKHAISEVVEKQKQLHSQADDAGQFGEYRYRDGRIAGLTEAGEIVCDVLASVWGM